jgi:hypothetical protein
MSDRSDSLAYYDVRDRLAADLRRGIAPQDVDGLVKHVREHANMTRGQAVEAVERFFGDLRRDLGRG